MEIGNVNFPKIELHLHLEGIVGFNDLSSLYKSANTDLPFFLKNGFPDTFPNFEDFVNTYYACCQPIQKENEFSRSIRFLKEYLEANQIIYAEISWTPFFYMNKGFDFDKSLGIMNESLEELGIRDQVNFIVDVQRDHGDEIMDRIFSKVKHAEDFKIAGIGLTGDETKEIPGRVAYWFRYLKEERQLGTTAHVGEYGSPKLIKQLLESLHPDRIGHGIRAAEDQELVEYIKEKNIHLETCPTSNVKLERVDSYEKHPLSWFLDQGVSVGLNSDDPGIFKSGLNSEYKKAYEKMDVPYSSFQILMKNALDASFLKENEKEKIRPKLV
ncbi:MAG: adenosine deaminase [Saprospiraceae bacterium]